MAKRTKKNETDRNSEELNINAHILGAGEVVEQHITDTLEVNYMPYAMSVIMSRAIPEIDGFKPSHRKLLYTMYKWAASGRHYKIRQYSRPHHAAEPPRRRGNLRDDDSFGAR